MKSPTAQLTNPDTVAVSRLHVWHGWCAGSRRHGTVAGRAQRFRVESGDGRLAARGGLCLGALALSEAHLAIATASSETDLDTKRLQHSTSILVHHDQYLIVFWGGFHLHFFSGCKGTHSTSGAGTLKFEFCYYRFPHALAGAH